MDQSQKQISVEKLREILNAEPNKKKAVQEALGFDRHTMSKILTGKRNIEAGELLTIADICKLDPFELAI